MHYRLDDLLLKLGVPEVKTTHSVRWHYLEAKHPNIGGYADVRIEGGGKYLIADLQHWRKTADYEDGDVGNISLESFHLLAERMGASDIFSITELSFDGTPYNTQAAPMIELGLAMFHSRAVEINLCMIEQKFTGTENPFEKVRLALQQTENGFKKPSAPGAFGVVIPFRARA